MRWTVFAALTAGLALSGCDATPPTAPADEPEPEVELSRLDAFWQGSRTYRVTVYNLTSTQPFTPPLLVTHGGHLRLFRVGHRASEGIQQVAENGNLGPIMDALAQSDDVDQVVVAAGDPPPLLQRESISVEIEASGGHPYLSWVSMLVCTNDGFTGRNRILLPHRIGRARTVYTGSYDAGTEINTEDFADLVPPCQIFGATSSDDPGTGMSNPALAEHRRIHPHRGIRGGSDLDRRLHGWRDPVAKIVIERIG